MRRLTRPLAFAAGAALAVGAIAVTAVPGQATESIELKTSGLEEGGLIVLSTQQDPADGYQRIGYVAPGASSVDWHQQLTADKECRLVLETLPDKSALVQIDAVDPATKSTKNLYAGFVGDSIGVRSTEKGKSSEGTGTPCGEANGTQQAVRVTFNGYALTAVEADIEAKYNADVRFEFASLDPTYDFDPGQAGTQPEVYKEDLTTGSGSDNNPDSGDNDNFRVSYRLQAPASAIVIGIDETGDTTGAVSLEGGGDGTLPEDGGLGEALGTGATVFEVTKAVDLLPCGGTAEDQFVGADFNGYTLVERLTDLAGGACEPLLYSLDWELGEGTATLVTFAVEASSVAQYRWTITAQPEALAGDPPRTRVSEIDYNFDGNSEPLAWCLGTYDEPNLPSTGVVRPPSGTDPGQGFCIIERDEKLTGPNDYVQVTETLYGLGDPLYFGN